MLSHALTDIGMVRKVNQDYVWESTRPVGAFPNLFILADGMGGTRGGDYASKYVAKRLREIIEKSKEHEVIKVLREAVLKINRELFEISLKNADLYGMGTTLVASVIIKDKLIVVNVGDSRLYAIGDGIEQITKDHSYVEEQVALGLMQRDSEEYKKNKHFLTRAIGVEPRIKMDIFERDLIPGELVLMCSDGLSNMLDDDLIFSIVAGRGGLAYKASTLIETANKKNASDNIAVILINPELGGGRYA